MPEAPAVDITLCIVSWNVWEDLRQCLQSLRQSPDVVQQVIVVDNASSDGTPTRVRESFPEVQLIANAVNRGFAAGSNQALAAGRGRYLFLLNPDTVVPPGGLRELIDFADQHPEAGIIGPQQRYPDGRLQYSARQFPTVRAALFRNTPLGKLFPRSAAVQDYLMAAWDHQSVREVDWVSGAAMLIRRQVYEQIGPLDEGFFWGSEDVDYCWRAHGIGWKVLYTPRPAIIHAIGRSTDRVRTRTIIRTHRSMYRLYRKHLARSPVGTVLIWLGVCLRASMLLLYSWSKRLVGK
ncbi:MAG: glycosyltransferase family 2 protein [candidate division WS1 bacterium]|jgi:GT2 family glycosyltransferase|nr:glycosyltransferase family 2 protein [candidate division WS1 bacterium]